MKLTNTQTWVLAGVAVVAAYMLLRKKPLEVADIKSNAIPPPAPQNVLKGMDVADIGKKKAPMELSFSGVKAPVKEPLYIRPRNVVPSIYDRGIGDELNFYGNVKDGATVNISTACKSADSRKRLPSELPQIN